MLEIEDGDESEKLMLEIDGILFDQHPYVDKDFGKSRKFHFVTHLSLS